MERFALLLLTITLVAFVILSIYVSLRSKDRFWIQPDDRPRRTRPDDRRRSFRRH